MESLDQLARARLLVRLRLSAGSEGIEWALERMRRDGDLKDLEVVLLAGASERDDVLPLIETILRRHGDAGDLDESLAAGKYLVFLRHQYKAGTETIAGVDEKLGRLNVLLGCPSWLVMLGRNCEYATDIANFVAPFESEFEYVTGIWTAAATTAEFLARYSREISNTHDWR